MVKINHRLVLMFILLFLLLGPGEVFACRYNVRDVAFVDFGRYPYRLYGFVNKDTPLEIKTSFEQIAYSALLDTNVVFELIDIDLQGIETDIERMLKLESEIRETEENMDLALRGSISGKTVNYIS